MPTIHRHSRHRSAASFNTPFKMDSSVNVSKKMMMMMMMMADTEEKKTVKEEKWAVETEEDMHELKQNGDGHKCTNKSKEGEERKKKKW